MSKLAPTPAQTVGPFFHYALPYDGDRDLIAPGTPGAVQFSGVVYDGTGAPVPDALVEIWQPDTEGNVVQEHGSLRRDGYTFTGFGRASTDRTGKFVFSTLRPGSMAEGRAPYFAVAVFARGLLNRCLTRAYLPGELAENDAFLTSVPAERRHTLMATEEGNRIVFDIRLQGEDETVFFGQ
ncbi:protocatechuate 3,4-dioxygenase subunit alpha [Nocardioides yefusunii]|uniref:Protocatechuate 3,4-dioxygenase subunit alpha n=1 Tax=Nocardioides yefusunii TaxID=2500546 RepID=A0ABW1QV68_9ACTN|nr:protocatechuate 3,4-dioxygenase subunit alpha [Nocardioides yefusunii]